MTYTPGPWIYDCGSFYASCQLNRDGLTIEKPIAEMVGGREDDWEGNAKIIRAAPEMYRILKLYVTTGPNELHHVVEEMEKFFEQLEEKIETNRRTHQRDKGDGSK